MRSLFGGRSEQYSRVSTTAPYPRGFSDVPLSDDEDERNAEERENAHNETETMCQKFLLTIGWTYFMPGSYHERRRREELALLIRTGERCKKELASDLRDALEKVREASLLFENKRRQLVKAFERTKGATDSHVSALQAELNICRTDLISANSFADAARGEYDHVNGILTQLRIDQRLSSNDRVEKLFDRYINKAKNPEKLIAAKQDMQLNAKEHARSIKTRMALNSRSAQQQGTDAMEDLETLVEECKADAERHLRKTGGADPERIQRRGSSASDTSFPMADLIGLETAPPA